MGVAVSGGSDSMAMLHLLARAAPQAGWSLCAVTVDHRLRPEAAEEAVFVARICQGLAVPHDVLVWDHGDIQGNLMQAASEARYTLMADWARGKGVDLIALGHTADDQAETFLMGLARAAGLDGLTGMQQAFAVNGVTFCRPFLQQTRADLRAYLTRHNVAWVDDPSNDSDRFTRVKARRALKALRPMGITVDRLSSVVHHLSKVQAVVRDAVASAAEGGISETAGALQLQRRSLRMCGPEIKRRLLIAMVGWIGGARHVPREAKIAALAHALDLGKDATLGGVRFRWQGDSCTVSREARACGPPVPVGLLWDGRWRVSGASGEIRALGAAGLRQGPDWRATGLTRQVLEVTPALWDGETLLAAPCAGFGAEVATCAPSFRDMLLSH
jgi:tRNA(Ile)-lysidine synthase